MRLTVWCDRIVLGGLVLLIVLTPLAFGGVHPVTSRVVAGAIFVLGLIALAKVALAGPPAAGWRQLPRTIWVPVGALLALVALQTVPLPPFLLGLVSPAAFGVYEQSLPGWPEAEPYTEIESLAAADGVETRWHVLRTPAEASAFAGPLAVPVGDRRAGRSRAAAGVGGVWRSLSLAPSATRDALIVVAGHVVAFLLVALYPWNRGDEGEHRAERVLVRTLLLTVVGIAALGLLQRFSWNGRILWLFVPFDWQGVPDPRPRTCGPFINRNHFAGYITLLFPMLLSGAIGLASLDGQRHGWRRRLLYVGGALTAGLASLLSLSRGGWIGLVVGVVALLALARAAGLETSGRLQASRRRRALAGALVVGVAIALLSPVAAGLRSGGRDIDARLAQTLGDTASWSARVRMWRGTVALVEESPVVGVGLGAWGELYPRYDRGSYDGVAPRAAHNDYLELLAELGILGFLLVGIALTAATRRVWARAGRRSRRGRAATVAALAGLVGLAVHELVEFNLQIPAIALSGAILLGGALRPALPHSSGGAAGRSRWYAMLGVVALGGLVALLLRPASPSWSGPPSSMGEALARIDTFPARARHHYELAALLRADAAAHLRHRELERAHWLAPRNPRIRDALAASFAEAGEHARALRMIERSVEIAPRREDHGYLAERLLPFLSPPEDRAVTRGLERAIAQGDPVAPRTLAAVHRGRGRPLAAAAVLVRAAERATADAERYALLLAAGVDYVQGGDAGAAARTLREASGLRPVATAPYVWRLAALQATDRGLAEAVGIAEEGAHRGADPAELWFAVASVAKRGGRARERQDALERVLELRPALAKAHFELGTLLLEQGRARRAVLALRHATERAPSSVAYWYHLARASHASHDIVGARRALDHALQLAPDHGDSRALLASVAALRP